jgi:hypothetical protein
MRQNSPEEHQYVSVKWERCMANRTYIELRRMRCAMVVASNHHGEGAGKGKGTGTGTALNTEVRPNVNGNGNTLNMEVRPNANCGLSGKP